MNDKNFDSLKNLKAPESWIENAINIPNAQEKPKPVFFLRYSRSLASVACLVLVCIITLIIALDRDENVLTIEPSYETVTTDATVNNETQNFTDATESVISETNKPTTSNGENGGAPFEGTIDNDSSANKPTTPTQKPNSDPTSSNETDVSPTESPVIKPTNLPTVKPTKPPTEKPSVRPPDEDSPNNPQSPGSPGDPYEPPTEGEEATPGIPDSNVFYTSFSTRYLDSSMQIYCSVQGPDGNLVVNYDQATVYNTDKYLAYVSYTLPSYAITKSGRYYCNFYTANGEHICSSSIYVQI